MLDSTPTREIYSMNVDNKIRILTFNIRGAVFTQDGVNAWHNRAALNVRTIERYVPDVIGFQELQEGNLETYRQQLTGYSYVKGPEYNNQEPYAYNAIFWNSSRLERLDSGGFWLSTTPDRWSADWETACIRSATWVRLRCANTGPDFVCLNTHLDHVSELARVEGSKVILRQIAYLQGNDLPVIVTGDFNCNPWSAAYNIFRAGGFADAYLAAGHEDAGDLHTFHAFAGEHFVPAPHHSTGRIDWILTRDGRQRVQTLASSILRDHEHPLYPSDHYPVLVEIKFV